MASVKQTDLRIVKTRQTIKSTLIALMAEKEISSITITEISSRAQINRKTFYRHYDSVSDVVTELENDILSDFSEILKNSNASCLDMGVVFRDISRQIDENRDYFLRMMKLNPDLFNKGRIKAMLRRAMAVSLKTMGGITDENTLSAVSEFIVSGVLSLYSAWFDNECRGSLDFLTETANALATSGLRAFVSAERLSAINL